MDELSSKSEFDRFDHFHDWVVREVRVFSNDGKDSVQPSYHAQLVLYDPYQRLLEDLVELHFEDVETASFEGMTTLQAEISDLKFTESDRWVAVHDDGSICIQAQRVSASCGKVDSINLA